jgi:hypothetical protein
VDGSIAYSDVDSSRLAITAEQGRSTLLGTRAYLQPDQIVWKGLFEDIEHFRVTQHSILVPSVKASMSSTLSTSYRASNVVTQGRIVRLTDSFPSDSFGQLAIRGYPKQIFYSRSAAVGALDYRFPLIRIFRGWGTNPVFLDNLYGFTFAETSVYPSQEPGHFALPSAGVGIQLSTELFIHVPVVTSVEYHQGFQTDAGGKGEIFVQLGLGAFGF